MSRLSWMVGIAKLVVILVVFCFSMATEAFAQRTDLYNRVIGLDFPQMPDQKVSLGLNNGSRVDRIYTGYTDDKGKLSIPVDELWKDYKGIACLWVADRDISFIFAEEDIVIYCASKSVNGENVIYGNSVENVLRQAMLKGQKTWLSESLPQGQMYAPAYGQCLVFSKMEVLEIKNLDNNKRTALRKQMVLQMDMDVLYTSGLWMQVLDRLSLLYNGDESMQKAFCIDMQDLAQKIVSHQAYREFTDFLDNCILEKKMQGKAMEKIVKSMKKDRRYWERV